MDKTNNIENIIEIENDTRILSFKTYDDIPIYLIGKEYLLFWKTMPLFIDMKIQNNDRKIGMEALSFMIKAIIYNMLHEKRKNRSDITFYAPCRPTHNQGVFFNRYTDYFSEIYKERSWTIEQTALDWTWPFPRHNDHVTFEGLNQAYARIMGSIQYKKDLKPAWDMTQYYNNRLKCLYGVSFNEKECNEIATIIAKKTEAARIKAKWFEKNIPHRTKIMIMIGGCYPEYYPIIRVLKKRGIVTADLQHGFITKNNPVYSYAENIRHSREIIEGSADYFLTYGNWWNNHILNSAKKIVVGNPYRDLCVRSLKKEVSKKRILIVGCEINTEKCINLTKFLSERLPDYEVLFRPHPGEMLATTRIMQHENTNISIDKEKEIYKSLYKTSVVISEASTVLFEAIGICKQIITLNTTYSNSMLTEHPFTRCNSNEEIIECILDDLHPNNSYQTEDFWASDFANRFKTFINEVEVIS